MYVFIFMSMYVYVYFLTQYQIIKFEDGISVLLRGFYMKRVVVDLIELSCRDSVSCEVESQLTPTPTLLRQ